MKSRGDRVRRAGRSGVAIGAACLIANCTHTYYFAGTAPPKFEGRELLVERFGDRPIKRSVNRVGVALTDGAHRLATPEELRTWQSGDVVPDVKFVSVEVSTTKRVWLDYALPAAGIGMTTVLVVLTPFASELSSNASSGLTLPFVLLLAAVAGLEFGLIGAGIGALSEGGESGGARFSP